MSTRELALTLQDTAAGLPWELWRNQLLSIFRLELQRNFLTRRGLWIYLLAFGPALLIAAHGLNPRIYERDTIEDDTKILAGIYQLFTLRLGIYFSCMGVFTRLFRAEMQEKSLHYYLLAPVRRELLVLGKWLAGVCVIAIVFGASTLLSFFAMYAHFGAAGREFIFNGPGLGHLQAYLTVTVLASLGYGALFLALGLFFANPIVPAVIVLLWEGINGILPALLKKLSVIFYLTPLCPVEVSADGLLALFTVVADPVPTAIAIPGLLLLTMSILLLACWKIRRVEIRYSGD